MSGSPVQFESTRGTAAAVTLPAALRRGLAPDGGLYLPARVPESKTPSSAGSDFGEFAAAVIRPWTDGLIPPDRLGRLVREALNFPVALTGIGDDIHVLELFHGPTLSFKDFGARTMARLLAHFGSGDDDVLTVLVATSGDTGSAVADGFAGIDGIRVILLFPDGQVSAVQEKQLTVERPGVYPLKVAGSFDDCQRMVKAAFADSRLRGMGLTTANSINVGRLIPQTVYYVWAWKQLQRSDIRFVVPSGNLGNLTAGVLAHLGGMPTAGFIAAHNANTFFPDLLAGRDPKPRPSIRTLSNAMDVGAPSNLERLERLLPPGRMRELIWSTSVDDEATLDRIGAVHRARGYLADPHTAVGLEAVDRWRRASGAEGPVIVLSTAHPAKFPETVARAAGSTPKAPERLASLDRARHASESLAADPEALADYLLGLPEGP